MNLPPREVINTLVRNLKLEGALALKGIIHLHLAAALIQAYAPAPEGAGETIRKQVGLVCAEDLAYLLVRCPKGVGLVDFFEQEDRFRRGIILNWAYRGMHANHRPDFLIIRLAPPSETETPKTEAV